VFLLDARRSSGSSTAVTAGAFEATRLILTCLMVTVVLTPRLPR
jgi:hypothetical protein